MVKRMIRTPSPIIALQWLVCTLLMAGCHSTDTTATTARSAGTPPNVLLLFVDDMNIWAGYMAAHPGSHPDVHTPTMDMLAQRGLVFDWGHCVSPICGPSRASVLTGMRPETTNVYHNRGNWIDYVPDAITLPRHFKLNGYTVLGAGKINHGEYTDYQAFVPEDWHAYGPGPGVVGGPFTHDELKQEGMAPSRYIERLDVSLPMNGISLIDRPTNRWSTFDWGPVQMSDSETRDGMVADWAIERLAESHDRPFFLAIGIYRPHQPFYVPQPYFDLYPHESINLPVTSAGDLGDVPVPGRHLARGAWTSGRHATVTEHNQWRQGVAGYLASITFADAQLGRVLEALEASPYADNTIIVLCSDHGWHLGEKEHWGKHTPWSEATRVPFIIVPARNGMPAGFEGGTRTDAQVTLMDIYPTLVAMCGLPDRAELEGNSLLPVFTNPDATGFEVAVSSVGRGTHSVCAGNPGKWRYIRWYDGSEELYDLEVDPHEWFNLGGDEQHDALKQRLASHIPEDDRFERFVRWGRWKCVFYVDGAVELYDMKAPAGISEQNDVAAENTEVVEAIRMYLVGHAITDKRVTIPAE